MTTKQLQGSAFCSICGEQVGEGGKAVCCSTATYDDDSYDDPICVDCCGGHGPCRIGGDFIDAKID